MDQLHFILGILVMSLAAGKVYTSRVCITKDLFGSYKVPEKDNVVSNVYRYTLSNGQATIQVIDYGATITAIKVPDSKGLVEDIVLGYDSLEGFLTTDNPYFGATVGRVANRIANSEFTVDGITYNVYRNLGDHSLHGGLRGFDKKLWSSSMKEDCVVMEYTSADGEEGYPGDVKVTVTYSLTSAPDNTLTIEYRATTTKRTPINLTNHAYFNLAGHRAGADALYRHYVAINADQITESNSEFIPTGRLIAVSGTEFDLKQPQKLGDAIKKTTIDGFDNNFVLLKGEPNVAAAKVEEPISGRTLEVRTSQPGLQFYTSNSITSIMGKASHNYKRHAAFCLEAQNFPDAVNHENFPKSIFGPGETYHHATSYKFGIKTTK